MIPRPHKSFVISGRTAARMLQSPGGALKVSLDLGLSRGQVRVDSHGILLPDGERVSRDELAGAFSQAEDCVEIAGGRCEKVYIFSRQTRKYYKLYQPFEDRAPTIVIAGATMHTIVGTDPWQDEAQKVEALAPPGGATCLDTCFGLGYSALLLARAGCRSVVSCEVDPNVLECAAANPWSRAAFEHERIETVASDVRDYLTGCTDRSFGAIFHDPPELQQAGELYGAALCSELARVIRPGGMLYHYVGAPGARTGRDLARGVMRRLREAGFAQVRRGPRGVLARRER